MDANWLTVSQMTEEQARETLEAIRWPNGVICPKCGSDKGAWKLESKPETKNKMRPGLYKCKICSQKFTVTMGTIFEDSHIPLHKWLQGIYLMNASKKGVSAHQIHRMLGITYKSAWFMCHRIRLAMTQGPLAEMMTGEVELDTTYVGGHDRFRHAQNRQAGELGNLYNKTPVFALVQRGGKLRAKARIVSNYDMRKEVLYAVSRKATLMTDESTAYEMLDPFYTREVVNHHKQHVNGRAYTNTLEGWFSLLKRGVTGTFHHVSEQHLDRYVDEFAFRYNHRKDTDAQRTRAAIEGTEGKRLTYKETKPR